MPGAIARYQPECRRRLASWRMPPSESRRAALGLEMSETGKSQFEIHLGSSFTDLVKLGCDY
jgi:hypothetical protein